MKFIYGFVLIVGLVMLMFFAGFYSGRNDCRVRVATQTRNVQTEIIKKQGEINAEVFNRGVGDIRRVLHEKYTIAE